MTPLALLAAVPPCPCDVKCDTKKPAAPGQRASWQGDAFFSRVEVMLGCNLLQVSRGIPTMKAPTQCGTSKVFAVSQWKEDGMWHCAGPFTCPAVTAGQEYQCVVIENRWGWEHCPVYCQLQGVSSGEGCFLFGFFQIRKLHKVQLRQSYPDCRDCLFPVLAGSWMIHE